MPSILFLLITWNSGEPQTTAIPPIQTHFFFFLKYYYFDYFWFPPFTNGFFLGKEAKEGPNENVFIFFYIEPLVKTWSLSSQLIGIKRRVGEKRRIQTAPRNRVNPVTSSLHFFFLSWLYDPLFFFFFFSPLFYYITIIITIKRDRDLMTLRLQCGLPVVQRIVGWFPFIIIIIILFLIFRFLLVNFVVFILAWHVHL